MTKLDIKPAPRSRRRRFLALLCAAFALPVLFLPMLAFAQATPDPLGAAAATADGGWSLISAYGPIWGGALLVHALGDVFLHDQHVLAQGRLLAVITGGLAVLGAVLEWHFLGKPSAGIAVTLIMAIKMMWSPTVTGKSPAGAPAGTSAVVMLLVALGLGSLALTPACTHEQRVELKSAAWKCTDPVRAEAVAALTPLAVSGIQAAASYDASLIDASKIKAMFSKANVLSDAGLLVACVAADAFAYLEHASSTPLPGAAASAPLVIDPGVLRSAFDQLRAEQFPGATFETAHGGI